MPSWYKLDNAAKIFPVIHNDYDSDSIFRFSAIFNEEIKYEYLEKALEKALSIYKTFCVRMRRGLFWYYFDNNNKTPKVKKENPFLYNSVSMAKNNGFLFSLSNYKKRLTIEIFHALSDGTGGLEFFKTICYYYLLECGYQINNDGQIQLETDSKEKTEDSFLKNYDKKVSKYKKESKAFRLLGNQYQSKWVDMFLLEMDINQVKQVSKKYESTVTEYIGGVILYSIYLKCFKDKKIKKANNVKLFIPVNARKYFSSLSLRNFVLYVRTNSNFLKDVTLTDCINDIKEVFKEELNKESLESRIKSNVKLEKNFGVRLLPLFIKNIAMKIGYRFLGANVNTMLYSNLGIVKIPSDMQKYISRFEFSIGVAKVVPISAASITYNDKFILSFSSKLIDTSIIKQAIDILKNDGLNLFVETNEESAINETL